MSLTCFSAEDWASAEMYLAPCFKAALIAASSVSSALPGSFDQQTRRLFR